MDFSEFCDKNQNINLGKKEYRENNEFSKNVTKTSDNGDKNAKNQANNQQFFENDKLKADIESKLSKYQNMNYDELKTELFKEAARQKQNGNLNSKKLEDIKNTLFPLLDAEQQKQLDGLINVLK